MRKCVVLMAIALATMSGQNNVFGGIHPEDIDHTCKPCANFWQFVNGAWLDKNPIPANQRRWGPIQILIERNHERVRTILDAAAAAADGTAQPANYHRMGDFYASCLDTATIDRLGVSPLKPDFDLIAKVQSKADLVAALIAFQQMPRPSGGNSQVVGLFRLSAGLDPKDPSRVVARISEREGAFRTPSSVLSLPDRDYYLKQDTRSQEIRDAFVEHAARMLEIAGASKADGAAQAKTILALETEYAGSVMTIADRRDPDNTYHPMNIKGLSELAPGFDWAQLLRRSGATESATLLVAEPEMIRKFNAQLETVPLEAWKAWLHWRTLKLAARYLSKPIADEDFRFEATVLAGIREPEPRWRACATIVDNELSDALGQTYAEKYFAAESKQRMLRLVEHLRTAMQEEIEQAAWMSPTTKQSALRKLAGIQVQVGYPDRWKDYTAIPMDRGRFFENARSAWRFAQSYELAKIGKPASRVDWTMTVTAVNAYSNTSELKIVFPAGILQPPFFDPQADDASNYAAIGAVIGHELGHQFDDTGSKFDDTGALRNWWSGQDRKNFENRADCVVEQFNTLEVGGGLHHNGRQVIGEALGDLSGLQTAYHAWKKALGGTTAPVLDGYTGDQRFFIAYAHSWGTHSRPEAERLQISTDNHPIPKWRANATLMNMPEFQAAFQCNPGDPMMRPASQRCRLW